MINKLKRLLFLLILPAFLAGCSGDADISYKVVQKSGYFSAGYDPLGYHTYDGYGLAVDVIKTAAERMGVEAPIRPVNDYDWEAHLANDDIDVMLCKASDGLLKTNPVFTDNIVMVSKENQITEKVGIIDSDACIRQKDFLSRENIHEVIYYSDSRLLLSDLSDGLLDAAVLSEYDALPTVGISNYTVSVLSESPIFFSVSPEKQTFYAELDAVLQQMAADGTIARLKNEYIQSLNRAD